MADLCSIGPVSITQAMLWDNNNFSITSGSNKTTAYGTTIFTKGQFNTEESFDVITTFDEAFQLKGLVEIGEPVWIDASTDLTDNDYFQHKGWYLLTNIDFEHLNATYMRCSIDCQFISSSINEYLTMDYSKGLYDGMSLDYTYSPTTTSYQLQDNMSTTVNWNAVEDAFVTSPVGASDGSEIYITAANDRGDGYYGGGMAWMRSLVKYTPPFTIETVLDRRTLPAAGAYDGSIAFGMSKEIMPKDSLDTVSKSFGQWFYAQWACGNSSTKFELATSRNGAWSQQYPWTSMGTTYDELGLKIQLELDGTMTVWTDLDTTGTWTQIYNGPINIDNLDQGLWMYLYVNNLDITPYTASFHKLDIYNSDKANPEYVTCLPCNANVQTPATGNRVGECGNIPYYTNPTDELRYTISQSDMYKGEVKLLSNNNSSSTIRQVYNTDVFLTPETTMLKNAFTQLTFAENEMTLAGNNGSTWEIISKGTIGNIDIIKPLLITHDKVVLQVNDIKFAMLRSSPMISMYHPKTAVDYVAFDNVFSNGTLDTTVAPGDSVPMTNLDNGYYSYMYNDAPGDTYRLVIGKKDPTTIKSNQIPADDITGVGWNTATQQGISGGVNTAAKLVQQWWKQTHTGISLKQIV